MTVVQIFNDQPEPIRQDPHDLHAEQVVLGSVMIEPRALADVRTLVSAQSFYRPAHALIWEAITGLADNGLPFDAVAVGAELGRDLTRIGGAPYLVDLMQRVPSAANAGYYAQLVRDAAFRRRVVETGTRLFQLGHDPDAGANLQSLVTAEIAAMTAVQVQGWPEPIPLSAVAELPPFPVEVLPDWMGEYAARLAEQTQTPVDLAGCLSLVVLAVAASGKVRLQAPTWKEALCLYVLMALPPGSRKSEVYAAMTAPIKAFEDELRAEAEPIITEAAMNRRIADVDAEKAEREALSATGVERDALKDVAVQKALEAQAIHVPAEPSLFTGNVTIEALSSIMAAQGGRYAVLSPEGEIFDIAAGQYSGSRRPNFGILKSGFTGEAVRVNRVTRKGEDIAHATLTLGICTQPSVLEGLGTIPEFQGQGLLGRILFSLPPSLFGTRRYRDAEPVPEHHTALYTANLSALIRTLHQFTESPLIPFDAEATEGVYDLLEANELRLHPDTGDLAHMTDWGAKIVGSILRISALLHLAEHTDHGTLLHTWQNPITARTLANAREIGDYFAKHAQAAYDAMGADPTVGDARAVLKWINTTSASRFTSRDVQRGNQHRFKKVARIEPALALLEAHGWIRKLPAPASSGRGRPAAITYEVHPEAHAS
ncbi:DUF3987 domain-containing protein [Actinocorallia libanotica]|uniref:DNA helicase DnaB-like N-terminal domain-containing protein n=1 Tax=Actinocorallia libanotica TaxID=46162 RepID=A0ABN1RYN5_9ACTN